MPAPGRVEVGGEVIAVDGPQLVLEPLGNLVDVEGVARARLGDELREEALGAVQQVVLGGGEQ